MFNEYMAPQPIDFYTKCLVEENMDPYYRTIAIVEQHSSMIIDNYGDTLGGLRMGQIYRQNALEIINAGIMRPGFRDYEDGSYDFWFEMWSVLDGTFKHPSQLTHVEATFANDLIMYHTRRN